jgi:hypothetical protein
VIVSICLCRMFIVSSRWITSSILIVLLVPWVSMSDFCSVFSSLTCFCFQSDMDFIRSLSSPVKTYSHLHCHPASLDLTTFRHLLNFDRQRFNQFRTISLEFVANGQLTIKSNQFDLLAKLFAETSDDAQIEIRLRFTGFTQITVEKRAFTSTMFHRRHQNTRFFLYLIPATVSETKVSVSVSRDTVDFRAFHLDSPRRRSFV